MFVHYCSSDTWSGTRAADEETGGYTFHGRHVFEVRLTKLQTTKVKQRLAKILRDCEILRLNFV